MLMGPALEPTLEAERTKSPVSAAAFATALVTGALAGGRSALDEWESKNLLAAYGIAVPKGALVASAGEAVAAAERIGGPVAMKGTAPVRFW